MKWLITGDTHGDFTRFRNLSYKQKNDEDLGIVILGDAGLNYLLDERDNYLKNKLTKNYKCKFYCVHGNHEEIPERVTNMVFEFDENVNGSVWYQPKWPNIRYFTMWGEYVIGGLRTAVLGGAYSVDKFWRLQNGARWFETEQMTPVERQYAELCLKNKHFDLVFSHTCPISWEPSDLFLSAVDQSTVDKTTELWLDKVKDTFNYNIWLFGHYHTDRLERPHVEQFYYNIESLDDIVDRWKKYDETKELDWWLQKSPNFYMK